MAKQISKSLVVGIGGTGQRIIISIKKRLYQRFGEIPKSIKFLSIDCDIIDARDEHFTYEYGGKIRSTHVTIEPGEKHYIEGKNLLEIFDKQSSYRKFAPPNFLDFAPEATTGQGAEGVRLVGKMLVASEYDLLRGKIDSLIGDAIRDDVSLELEESGYEIDHSRPFLCFLIGSLAGGAGSGILKDVSDLLHTCHELDKTDLIGFFAMPEFYKDYANTSNARVNAYTALVEIDHLQNPQVFRKTSAENIETFDGKKIRAKRFNSIFLMQNKLANGTKIDTKTMEDATSVAVSNLVSAIGNKIVSSVVNNHQFKKNLMNGKRRGYSGFGVCEINFNRQELVDYLLDKIVLDSLNEYSVNNFNKNEFVNEVNDFILENNLDEGVGDKAQTINKLIDSIYTLNDDSFSNVSFPIISVSDSLCSDLDTAGNHYVQDIGLKLLGICKEFDVNQILDNLEQKLRELLYAKGGVSRAKHFSDIFSNQINLMQDGLSKEIVEHKSEIKKIKKNMEITIAEIRTKQKAALSFFQNRKIREYAKKYETLVSNRSGNINSLRTHILETKRKEKAVEIFMLLKKQIEIYTGYKNGEGKITKIANFLNSAISDISLSIRQFVPNLADDIRIDINYFMKKIVDDTEESNNTGLNNLKIDFGKLINRQSLTLDSNTIDLIKTEILKRNNKLESDTILSNLSDPDYGIEDIINQFKNDKLSIGNKEIGLKTTTFESLLTSTVRNKISMMWRYKNMSFEDDEKQVQLPEKIFVIGNYGGSEKFFTNTIIQNLQLKNIKSQGVTRVATHDNNRITLHIQENAIPAFNLLNMDSYLNEFNTRKDSRSSWFFSDKRFESFADGIFPQENQERALRLWTIGLMTGNIVNLRKAYYVKSSKGLDGQFVPCYDESKTRGKNNRQKAYEFFIENESLVEEIDTIFNLLIERDQSSLRQDLLEYFHKGLYSKTNLGKIYSSTTEDEKKLIYSEKKELVDIGVYDLHMNDYDFINKDVEGDELKKHKQELRNLGLDILN